MWANQQNGNFNSVYQFFCHGTDNQTFEATTAFCSYHEQISPPFGCGASDNFRDAVQAVLFHGAQQTGFHLRYAPRG